MKINMNKLLGQLSLQEYESLKDTGMLWVYYPEATGNYNCDLEATVVNVVKMFTPIVTHYASDRHSVKVYFYDIIDEDAEYE